MTASRSKTLDLGAKDAAEVESPELTDEEIASLRPAAEALPPKLYAMLTSRKPGQRGPQKSPTKAMLTLRVDRDVLSAYRATGPGWQSRMNAVLKAAAPAGRKTSGG